MVSNVITNRRKGTLDHVLFIIAFFTLLFFSISSAYALVTNPTYPTNWSMLCFFIGILSILLLVEDNQFPKLPVKTLPETILFWFSSWMFVTFLSSFLFNLDFSYLGLSVLFGIILVVIGSKTVHSVKKISLNDGKKKKGTRKIRGY